MKIEQEGEVIRVTRPNDAKENRSLHGLTRTLIHNMVVGVTEGYKKELDVNGVGYRVAKEGNKLVMNLGFSHQVIMEEIEGITIEVPGPNKIVIHGCDKQKPPAFPSQDHPAGRGAGTRPAGIQAQIGRASCRERV